MVVERKQCSHWSRRLRNALVYADADVLRNDIERLKIANE
jgi:hypothetical protein